MHRLPEKLSLALQGELKIGEFVSWTCMPNSFYSILTAAPSFLFGIPWNAFLFSMHEKRFNQIDQIKPVYLDLFLIPFYLVGIYLFLTPLIEWWKARRTLYVITNKRAFTLKSLTSVSVESFYPGNIDNIKKTVRHNGSGSLIFARAHHTDSDDDKMVTDYGFFFLPNVKEAEMHLEKLISDDKTLKRDF